MTFILLHLFQLHPLHVCYNDALGDLCHIRAIIPLPWFITQYCTKGNKQEYQIMNEFILHLIKRTKNKHKDTGAIFISNYFEWNIYLS